MAGSALAPAISEMSLSGSGARGMVSLIFTCAGVINGAAAGGQEERGATSPGSQPASFHRPPGSQAAQHPNISPPRRRQRYPVGGVGGGGF